MNINPLAHAPYIIVKRSVYSYVECFVFIYYYGNEDDDDGTSVKLTVVV